MSLPQHILVMRFSALGDVAMVVPVLRILRQTYPELKITVLSRPFFKPLFEFIPNVNFISADLKKEHKGLRIFKLGSQVKATKIDAVADLHDVLRTKMLSVYFRLHGISVKTIDKGRKEKKALVSGNPKSFKQLKTTHQRYAEVFAQLGYPISLENYSPPRKPEIPEKFCVFLADASKNIIGIAPFAAHEGKMYPPDLMKKLLKILEKSGNYKILLFGGGAHEIKQLNVWEKEVEHCVNVAGKLSFSDELRLISNVDAFISMDSGNGHLAAIFGIPVLTLWGVTHPFAGFAPFQQDEKNQLTADRKKYPLIPTSIYGNKFPPGYKNAMRTISPEKIAAELARVLKNIKKN